MWASSIFAHPSSSPSHRPHISVIISKDVQECSVDHALDCSCSSGFLPTKTIVVTIAIDWGSDLEFEVINTGMLESLHLFGTCGVSDAATTSLDVNLVVTANQLADR